MGLVIPTLFDELRRPAMKQIVDTVRHIDYIRMVVIALGDADPQQFRHTCRWFSRLATDERRVRVIWNGGPRLQRRYRILEEQGVPCNQSGKGRAIWAAIGYLLAQDDTQVIIQHDADIHNYQRSIIDRLAYPVLDPESRLQYCKGYYARISDRLNGRVTRLFVTPLVRSMRRILDDPSFLRQLDAYRYALSGESVMDARLAAQIQVPTDWGLEIGTLSEVHHLLDTSQIAQVDIADAYDHKHKPLSKDNPDGGLQKMAIEVAHSLLETLDAQGVPLDAHRLHQIQNAYRTEALEYLKRYRMDAVLNGLHYDRAMELEAVDVFGQALKTAIHRFRDHETRGTWLPSWRQVSDLFPEFPDLFHEAIEQDNAPSRSQKARTIMPRT